MTKHPARRRALGLVLMAAGGFAMSATRAEQAPASPAVRIEARSADLWAVGMVRDDRMAIHLSRLVDNAPVRDAVITVVLRGVTHPTIAEADGSYTLRSTDLDLPGSAAVVFQVVQGDARQELRGALNIEAGQAKPDDRNSSRQLWWWVLNFAVCIGFLMLISKRRKAAAAND